MGKIIISFLIISFIVLFSPALRAEEAIITPTTITETDATQSLGLKKIGFLPGSPFYFLKEWRLRIKSVFIRDPIEKAKFQLEILSQKLTEAEKLAEKNSREEILKMAFDNYKKAMERLKIRLEELKTFSKNPEIEKLLDKIVEAEIRHQEVLEKILKITSGQEEAIRGARKGILENFSFFRLRFENQKEFMEKLESKIDELNLSSLPQPLGELRKLRLMEALKKQLENVSLENYPEEIRIKIEKLMEKLKIKIEQRRAVLEKQGFSKETIEKILESAIEPLPKIPPEKLPKGHPPGAKPNRYPEPTLKKPSLEKPEKFCIALWDPVCGEDGITYQNSCFAEIAGVKVEFKGECSLPREPRE